MNTKAVYLDHNASTPCANEVVEAMLPFFTNAFANPSSNSFMGRMAALAVEDAREKIAAAVDAVNHQIIFTSGATEANNSILRGLSDRLTNRNRVVVFSLEHKSVLEPCRWLASRGAQIIKAPCDDQGVIDIHFAKDCIDTDTLMVCIQGANNEIGTIQPVAEIADLAHARGAFVHCDATQLLSNVPLSVSELGVDSLSLSAHKAYGPKGVGALVIRKGVVKHLATPLLLGGGQENQYRSGTVNVPGVVGFGKACELVRDRYIPSS